MPFLHPLLKNLDQNELLRYAGVREDTAALEESLAAAIKEAYLYCQPKGVWELYKYEQPAIKSDTQEYLPASEKLCLHLRGSLKVAVLAVTVGEEVEKRIETLFASGEYTKAVLLDAAATVATEQTADQVCAFIADSVKKEGLFTGVRFSPGYGDWDIKEQPNVLTLANATAIGITMTKSFMLLPRKSVTAIVGLKPLAGEKEQPDNCSLCEKTDCQLRRKTNA